jgi:D-tyrosyl-tRNA(Tyr) deacylase
MRALVQRVMNASVVIGNRTHSEINYGLLILLGIHENDSETDADHLCKKVNDLRIFNDENGKLNLSQADINAELMVVSQFTLYADTVKGNRPSYSKAAHPDKAIPLYEYFIRQLSGISGKNIATGIFGADMQVHLVNDGPVTIMIESLEGHIR